MKAITVQDDADNSLIWDDVDLPPLRRGEVKIRTHAAGVNRADLLQRKGMYPPSEGASGILGLEVAGEVVDVGEAVENLERGDRVCSLLSGGGYAEYVNVDAGMLLKLHPDMSYAEAAAIPEVFYTAFLNIFLEGTHKQGDRVLIHAAASGVGTAAVQLCKYFGSSVFGTASGSKLERVEQLGLDFGIDRHSDDFVDALQSEAGVDAVDIILDPVGADYLEQNLDILETGGRLLLIGLLSGSKTDIKLHKVLRNRARIIGSTLRSRSPEFKKRLTRRFRQDVWPGFISGQLEPVIYERLDIREAEKAHELLTNNETIGKVILEFS